MYDAIVVGARVAGSPTAMLLARKGHRVLLVDRATFPSDIMSTHFIHPEGVAALQRWGVLDQVLASGAPPIASTRLNFGIAEVERPPFAYESTAIALCPRRTILDHVLAEAAVAAGAELRQGFSVQEIIMDGGQVTGVRGRNADGVEVVEQARVVIGADGKNSMVARAVKAPSYNDRPSPTCGYYSYFSGIELGGTSEITFLPGRALFFFPTNDDLTCVAVESSGAAFQEFRADIEGNFMKALEQGGFGARMHGATREEKYIGTADLPSFYRKPYGPGWALAGDAGYHKDPITGWGITDAFRDAELLASALDAGWSGRAPLDAALAGYEQRRNDATAVIYEQTCAMAQLPAYTPRMLEQMFGAAPAA